MVVTGDGNVGIGTASPVSILHVRGTGQTSATSFDTSQTLGASIFVQSSDSVPGSGGSLVLGTYQGKFAAIKAGILNGTNNTVGNLHFMTRNATTDATLTNRMTITNTGNVGIGTNNPRCRLDVQGGGTRCSYPFGIGGTSTYATYTHTGVGGIANNAGSWTKDFVVGTYERGGWIRVYSGATKSGSAANGQVQNPKTAEFVYSIYGNSLYWNRVSGSTNISLSSSGYQTIRVSSSGGGSYNHGWVEIWQQGGVAIF